MSFIKRVKRSIARSIKPKKVTSRMDERWSAVVELVPPAKDKFEAAERVLKGEDYAAEYLAPTRRTVSSISVVGQMKGLVKMFLVGQLMTQFYLGEGGSYYWQGGDGLWLDAGQRIFFVMEDGEIGGGKVTIEGMK